MPTSKGCLKVTSILVKISKANVEMQTHKVTFKDFTLFLCSDTCTCLCIHECINLCAKQGCIYSVFANQAHN